MKRSLLVFYLNFAILFTIQAQPTYVWAKKVGGGLSDYGYSIAVDASGNHYITGAFAAFNVDFDPGPGTATLSTNGGDDIYLAKYDAAGNYQWVKKIGANLSEQANEIFLDPSGNIYLTGFFSDTVDFDPGTGVANLIAAAGSDVFAAKYDNNGNYLWALGFGGPVSDAGYSIAADNSGSVYITGTFSGSNIDFDPGPGTSTLSTTSSSEDVFIAKYDNNGNFVWADRIGSGVIDRGYAIALDGLDNVYVAGTFNGLNVDFDPGPGTYNLSSSGSEDVFICKFHSNGTLIWAKNVGGTGSDQAFTMEVDPGANVYVSGWFNSATADFDPDAGTATLTGSGNADVFIAKYDSSLNYTWAKQIGAAGGETCQGLCLDGVGNLYITGSFNSANLDFDPGPGTATLSPVATSDIFFAKYDTSGNYAWAASIGGTSGEAGYGIAAGANGYVSITGYFGGSNVDFNPGPGTNTLSASGTTDIFFGRYHNCSAAPAQPGTISGPASICENSVNSYSIATVTDALWYTWSTPATFTASAVGTSATVTAGNTSGTFSVTANNPCGSSPTQTLLVTVNPLPGILASANPEACEGSNYCMSVAGASTYTWTGPCGFSNTGATPCINNITGCSAGTYSVIGSDLNGCVGTDTFSLIIHALPTVSYMQSPMYACINWSPFSLSPGTPSGGGYSGTGVSGSTFDPSVSGAGLFTVTYSYSDINGCVGTDTSSVNVDLCTGISAANPGGIYSVSIDPRSDQVIIEQPGGIFVNDLRIELFDLCGQLITRSVIYPSQNKRAGVSIPGVPHGLYLYKIAQGSTQLQSGKLLIYQAQ